MWTPYAPARSAEQHPRMRFLDTVSRAIDVFEDTAADAALAYPMPPDRWVEPIMEVELTTDFTFGPDAV